MYRKKIVCLLAALLLCLGGCGGGQPERGDSGGRKQETSAVNSGGGKEEASGQEDGASKEDFVPYTAPAFAGSAFHADKAQGKGDIQVDLSAVSQGYVGVTGKAEKRMKCTITKTDTEESYVYNLDNGGAPSIYPISCGDGSYLLKVLEQTVDSKYAVLYKVEFEVVLEDEFQPFLRPSDYVNYQENSACVKKAAELASGAEDALGVVAAVYDYICENVTYDNEKVRMVQENKTYLPDPDDTIATGKGICFDYAALVAAMLRSQGIPVKLIVGDVSPEAQRHAWNMFYTQETGWVTVDFQVDADSWNRLDLTFSANGQGNSFIGDGENYTDLYTY